MKKEVDKELRREIIISITIISLFAIFMFSPRGNSSNTQNKLPQEGEYRQDSETGAYEVYYEGNWEDSRYYEQIMEEKNYYDGEAWQYEPIYFLKSGYYFHSSKDCKGLKGYENIEEDIFGNISEYPNLDACNWCVGE